MSERSTSPRRSHTYTDEEVAAVFSTPEPEIQQWLRATANERRPAVERAIRAFGGEPENKTY